MGLDSRNSSEYIEYNTLYKQIRAAIAGYHKVIGLVTDLPNPQYRNVYNVTGMSDSQRVAATQAELASNARRQAYWSRGRYHNATGRTHVSLNGMIWAKDPEVEMPSQMAYIEDNADGSGSDLRDVVQGLVSETLITSRTLCLVDMPESSERPTAAQLESGELAPRIITYLAENIVGAWVDDSGNLSEVRLLETRCEKDGEFDYKDVTYIRRLVMIDGVYRNQLFDIKEKLVSDSEPKANGQSFGFIPCVIFGSESNSIKYNKPPLYDLAHTNLGHFVLDCDNRDNLHYHGQGMTVVYTNMDATDFNIMNPNGLDTGAKGKNLLGQGDKVEVLQIAAIGAIAEEMTRDEKRMIALGAQLVQDSNTNVTLGAKEMEFGASTSTLKQISRNVSIGVEYLLSYVAMFLGVTGEIKYRLNTQFVTDDMTPEMIARHMEMVQMGTLSPSTLYETARSAGFTNKSDEELQAEAEQAQLMAQGESEELASLRAQLEAMQGAE